MSQPSLDKKMFEASGFATLIGSLPASNHSDALQSVLENTGEVPIWPQLPGRPLEGMMTQFVEGFPGLVQENGRVYFDISRDGFADEHLAFFEEYIAAAEDPAFLLTSRFQVSRERAEGLYQVCETVRPEGGAFAVKGQVTGPFTLLTGLKDQDNRLGYYDPTIREIGVKGIAMKAAWQVRFLQDTGLPVLLFIDEPALAGLGSSSFISISLDDIGQDLTEVITAIHDAGGLAGIHVCANTDWNFLMSLDLDILSFDAYGFFDRLVTCRDQVLAFIARGGIIAWGIVPTSDEEKIMLESAESLVALWEKQAAMLASGDDLGPILRHTLITPSCGTGSLSPELAGRVLTLTRDVSRILREKHSTVSS